METHLYPLFVSWSFLVHTFSYTILRKSLPFKKQPTVLTPVLNLQFSLFSKREYRGELPLGVRASAGISAEHQASHWDCSATTVISKRPEDEKRTEMLKTSENLRSEITIGARHCKAAVFAVNADQHHGSCFCGWHRLNLKKQARNFRSYLPYFGALVMLAYATIKYGEKWSVLCSCFLHLFAGRSQAES